MESLDPASVFQTLGNLCDSDSASRFNNGTFYTHVDGNDTDNSLVLINN